MADEVTRSAVRWATIIAVPVALLAAVLVFVSVDGSGSPKAPESPRVRSSAPVPMTARGLAARPTIVCRALLSQLPPTVRDLAQRPVTEGTEQNAAYGDPPITVACGTTMPSFAPTDMVSKLDGVCWYSAERSGATVWTTVDRSVPVTVTVPGGYDQPGQWVITFSTPVAAAIPAAASVPFGCRN